VHLSGHDANIGSAHRLSTSSGEGSIRQQLVCGSRFIGEVLRLVWDIRSLEGARRRSAFVSLIIPWGNTGKLQLGAEVEPLTGEIGLQAAKIRFRMSETMRHPII